MKEAPLACWSALAADAAAVGGGGGGDADADADDGDNDDGDDDAALTEALLSGHLLWRPRSHSEPKQSWPLSKQGHRKHLIGGCTQGLLCPSASKSKPEVALVASA